MTILLATSQRKMCVLLLILVTTGNYLCARETVVQSDQNQVNFHPFNGLVNIFPVTAAESTEANSSYTYQQTTGNRLISGHGNLPSAKTLDVTLLDEPRWVVAFPIGISSVWVVVLADGQIQVFLLTGNIVEHLPVDHPNSVISPPALGLIDDSIQLMIPHTPSGAPLTHPVLLNFPQLTLASLGIEGNLVIWEYDRITHLLIDALTDSRLLTDEKGRVLVLTNPSTRYAHGILGDTIEATGVALVETLPCPQVIVEISVPSPYVIEGLSPIWADLDGDGSREILITVSDAVEGARLLAYTEDGVQHSSGQAIGRGYRWLHQLAVAPFGPNGEVEIATVLTPHIGGIVEFYQLIDNRLEVVARVPGYSTHVIRSRNLDMALAADFDSDGRIELLVPYQQFDTLGAIRRTVDGAEVAWSIPVGGRISTNIAAVQLADENIVVGVGHSEKILRLWIP
ncbi:MAG: hypothetical protein GY774_38060 [Planctomycetes bacterium]|nr:hypothetical protein [Planctomycetota bacterium]